MKKISLFQPVIYIGLAIILLGCIPNTYSATPVKATIASLNVVKTTTSTPSPLPTILMNTRTPTVAPSAHPRPLPTQGELNDTDFIIQLLQTNGGCELPCFWGIVPGETNWGETEKFLISLSLKIEVTRDETVIGTDGTSSRRRQFSIYASDAKTYMFALQARDNLVTGIEVNPPLTDHHFLLKKLLSNQGIPTKIFISTHANVMDPPTAFSLILYYQEQRFLAVYSTLVYEENEQITACLDNIGPTILIFPDKKDLTDQQIQEIFLGPDPLGVLSVEDALGMSPTDFYETYRDSKTSCLITPANIWP